MKYLDKLKIFENIQITTLNNSEIASCDKSRHIQNADKIKLSAFENSRPVKHLITHFKIMAIKIKKKKKSDATVPNFIAHKKSRQG